MDNLTEWLAIIVPVAVSILVGTWNFFIRPTLRLKTDIDPARGQDDYYLRLQVKNIGIRTAKNCIGRLIEIHSVDDAKQVRIPQLNFCWEMQNQLDEPGPVDIPRRPFSIHLDLARYTTDDPTHLRLRVNTHGQQLSEGQYYADLCQLAIPVGTYDILVSIHSDHWLVKPKRWYVLKWSGTEYTIEQRKRWFRAQS